MAMKAGRSRGKSTEIRLHCVRSSSGMAIMPDFRYRLSLTVTLVVLVAMYASCACAISSDFEWGDDGWTAAGGRHGSVEEVMHAPRLLKAGDTGPGAWSFVAPDQYLGDQRGTIDGVLEYRIGFLGFDGEWEGGEEVFDVEVESMKHGMVLGRRGLVPPKAFMASVQAKLCAQCGWEVAGARGGAPSSHDFEVGVHVCTCACVCMCFLFNLRFDS